MYDKGASKITIGGLLEVYPTPGLVIATLTIFPLLIVAVPINLMLGVPVLDVATPTLTYVWIPTLYPDPLLPILIEEMVPAIETIAVPPAETSGWYADPSVDATETIIPPRGILAVFTSYVVEAWDPVKNTEVIPAYSFRIQFSEITWLSTDFAGPWNMLLIKIMELLVDIPVIFEPLFLRVNFEVYPSKSVDTSSKI